MMRLISLFSTYLVLWVVSASCQAPPTVDEVLREEGVGTSHDQLVAALSNPQARVRGLAAAELAEHHDLQAIGPLIEALSSESIPSERLNIARALTALRSPQGRTALIRLCTDDKLPADLRLMSASDLLPEGSFQCSSAVVALLPRISDPPDQQAALVYLIAVNDPSLSVRPGESFLAGIRQALVSTVPTIRRKAAECAAAYRLVAAKSDLATALSVEKDPDTMITLRKAIDSL